MKLTVMERLTCIAGVKQEGDIIFLSIRLTLVKKLALTEDELKKYNVKIDLNGLARWDLTVPQETEIDLSEIETNLLVDYVTKLNNAHKLKVEQLDLYYKLVKQ